MAAIAWLPWSTESFERARSERKPVLLSITATWCRHCAAMDRTTFADTALAARVADGFVPVRVDADRRPDVSQRYLLGGLPTVAFLTPDGDVIGGGTFVEAPRLTGMLQQVADAFARGLPPPPAGAGATAAPGPPPTREELTAIVIGSFDDEHAGFGGAPKFPHAAPVRLALDLYADTGVDRFKEIAVRTLDAMGWGPLYDEQLGGFFRCCAAADWQQPNPEKLLDVNASLLTLYLHGFEVLRLARYGERAEDILRYVQTWLADQAEGGWAASQSADGWRDADDAGATPAAVDSTMYADWNAVMASAALDAGRVMNDESLSTFALMSLERIVLACYRPGSGVSHHSERLDRDAPMRLTTMTMKTTEPVRGLLDDHVALALAHLDAFEATGNVVYRMMAEELALHAIRTMWDDDEGGFFDHAPGIGTPIGLLREPQKPFSGNCTAARLLRRLGAASDNPAYAERAERTLHALAARAAAAGPLAAEYLLALRTPAQR